MIVVFHPEFPVDQRRFEARYAEISVGLAQRFRREIEDAIDAIRAAPGAAGHFVNTSSTVAVEFRRRNLHAFPYFILYGWNSNTLVFGSVVPTRSDPLNWLARFPGQ